MKFLLGFVAVSLLIASSAFAQLCIPNLTSTKRPKVTAWIAWGEPDISQALADFSAKLPNWSQQTAKFIANPAHEPFKTCEPQIPPAVCLTDTSPWIVLFESPLCP